MGSLANQRKKKKQEIIQWHGFLLQLPKGVFTSPLPMGSTKTRSLQAFTARKKVRLPEIVKKRSWTMPNICADLGIDRLLNVQLGQRKTNSINVKWLQCHTIRPSRPGFSVLQGTNNCKKKKKKKKKKYSVLTPLL